MAKHVCSVCGNHHHFSSRRGAYFCDPCDEWVEKKCSDDECYYCKGRPTRPSLSELKIAEIKEKTV